MDKRVSDFSVDSKGYCFLCLQKVSYHLNPVKLDSTLDTPSSVYSLQNISRYLKLDMRRVFIQGGPVPSHLLTKVEKSRLKVELCGECALMTENISKQCRQLEKLKLEIQSGLESIQCKIFEAQETGRIEQFRRITGSDPSSVMGGSLEILEVLRMETMQKCSRMMKTTTPRLQIQRLTNEEILRGTFRIPDEEPETISKRMPDLGLQSSIIKLEEPDGLVDWAMDDDNDLCENSFGDDLDCNEDDTTITVGVDEAGTTSGKATHKNKIETGKTSQQKYEINHLTGKYKCQLCPIEYATKSGFRLHYNKVHRKIRFKCKICGKEFTQKGNYKTHHQSAHMGVRFQCQVCKKTFSEKGNLNKHQRKKRCVGEMG